MHQEPARGVVGHADARHPSAWSPRASRVRFAYPGYGIRCGSLEPDGRDSPGRVSSQMGTQTGVARISAAHPGLFTVNASGAGARCCWACVARHPSAWSPRASRVRFAYPGYRMRCGSLEPDGRDSPGRVNSQMGTPTGVARISAAHPGLCAVNASGSGARCCWACGCTPSISESPRASRVRFAYPGYSMRCVSLEPDGRDSPGRVRSQMGTPTGVARISAAHPGLFAVNASGAGAWCY